MPNILLQHADILTLDTEGRVLRDAAVAISDGTITAVGETPADFQADEIVDATGHIVMPGFFNAHAHSAMTLFRGYAEDLPLDRWLNERIFPVESALTADDVYWGASLAAAEMIRGGTVGFADHYFHMDRVAQVAVESGLRANLAWCMFGREEGEIGADLAEIAAFTEQWQGAAGGRIRTMLGPHSAHTCTPQFLARTAAVAAPSGRRHPHPSGRDRKRKSNVRWRSTTCGWSNSWRRTGCSRCPSSPPRDPSGGLRARDAGGRRRDGGAVSHDAHENGLRCHAGAGAAGRRGERGAGHRRRGQHRPPGHVPGGAPRRPDSEVQREGCDGDARRSGVAPGHAERRPRAGIRQSGEIAPGRAADLILLDCSAPHLQPRHDLAASVLYAAGSQDVSDVMVAGKWLLRKRRLLTLDEERIRDEIQQRAERLRLAAAPLAAMNRYPAGEPAP